MNQPNNPKIPIRNIFYMLCYAWNILDFSKNDKFDVDNCPDIYNLLTRVFIFGVNKIIRSGLYCTYEPRTDELPTLRGQINFTTTINQRTLQHKRLVCNFDEYTQNTPFNQTIKYTIESLLRNRDVEQTLKTELKQQYQFFGQISSLPPTKTNRRNFSYTRNNHLYKIPISIAILLYDSLTVLDKNGQNAFNSFYRQKNMERVFELFLLNFYKSRLNPSTHLVHAPTINWPISETAAKTWSVFFDVLPNPANRRTDIVIENHQLNLQLIFDAKYYAETLTDAYMDGENKKIRTSHLNQLRGYILDSNFKGKKLGALLYPTTTTDFNNGAIVPILNSPIIIKTIDLAQEWPNIENDLLIFIKKCEASVVALDS